MKKTLLTERFQELAGIKPIYEVKQKNGFKRGDIGKIGGPMVPLGPEPGGGGGGVDIPKPGPWPKENTDPLTLEMKKFTQPGLEDESTNLDNSITAWRKAIVLAFGEDDYDKNQEMKDFESAYSKMLNQYYHQDIRMEEGKQ